jgi:catechol 2,3-dioxygenase-like lactoylglutathione lyase family enzyme
MRCSMAFMRYIVPDVDEAVAFYTEQLRFELVQQFGPAFATVRRGDLSLWLSGPTSSAARPMPDGRQPEPGGWNRLVIEVDDIEAAVAKLRERGVSFRNDVVEGPGGRQIVLDDPAGNAVELFQPA